MNIIKLEEEVSKCQVKLNECAEWLKDNLEQVLRDAFTKYPDLHLGSLSWRQYTIYFNDGDTCPFIITTPELTTTDGSDIDIYEQNLPEEIEAILSMITDEDMMLRAFDDHTEFEFDGETLKVSCYDNHD